MNAWLVSDVGGGQEILKFNEQQYTRLYAGGITGINRS